MHLVSCGQCTCKNANFEFFVKWSMVVGTNNLTNEHDTTEVITPFQSESTAHFNDINISYCEKIPKIGENPLIIDLAL